MSDSTALPDWTSAYMDDRPAAPAGMAPADLSSAYGQPPLPVPPIPPRPSILETPWESIKTAATGAAENIGQAATGLKKWVTGEDKPVEFPNTPNLLTGPKSEEVRAGMPWQLAAAYTMGARPEQLEQVALAHLPGAETRAPDKYGHRMIRVGGQDYYLSKPGLELQDVVGGVGKGVASTAAALGIAATGPVSIPLAIGAQAAGQGLTEYGTGEIIRQLGAKRGADPIDVALAAGGSLVGDTVARVARAGWQAFRGTGGQMIAPRALAGVAPGATVTPGMLNETGRRVLAAAGVQAGDLTVEQLQQVQRTIGTAARQAADQPAIAARAVQSARQDLPMTAGQLTGNPTQLWLEKNLRQGESSQIMTAFDQLQAQRLQAAAARNVPGANPAAPRADELTLGERIQSGVERRGQELEGAERTAWSPFDTLTPRGEAMDPQGLQFGRIISQGMADSLDQLGVERIINDNMGAARRARELVTRATIRPETVTVPTGYTSNGVPVTTTRTVMRPAPLNLGDVLQLRRDLGSQIGAANTPSERAIITGMKNALDRHLDEAATRDVINGDPSRLAELRDAMSASRDRFNFWGPDNRVAAKFMQRLRDGDLNGQQVFNAVYGAGQLSGAGPTTQILDTLRQQFGTNSPLWRDTQAAGVTRMLFGSYERPAEMTATALDRRITEAVRGNGRAVFEGLGVDPAGLERLQEAARALQQSQSRNPSGTGGDVAQLVRSYVAKLPFARQIMEAHAERQAQRATGGGAGARLRAGMFPAERRYGPAVGAAGGGLLGPGLLPMLGPRQ